MTKFFTGIKESMGLPVRKPSWLSDARWNVFIPSCKTSSTVMSKAERKEIWFFTTKSYSYSSLMASEAQQLCKSTRTQENKPS